MKVIVFSNEPESWDGNTVYTYKTIFCLPESGALIRVINPDFDLTNYVSKEIDCLISIDLFRRLIEIKETPMTLIQGIVRLTQKNKQENWHYRIS